MRFGATIIARTLALCIAILVLTSPQMLAQRIDLYRVEGWRIPGVRVIANGSVKPKTVTKIIGIQEIKILAYKVDSAPAANRIERLPFLVPIRDQQNGFVFREIDIAASTIWAYE